MVVKYSSYLEKAEAETGLDDWGDDRFLEPLEVYLASSEESGNFHSRGKALFDAGIQRLLQNRLLIQSELAKSSRLSPLRGAPLFIVGMPRTGSTLLHQLLACDSSSRSLRYYEGLIPAHSGDPDSDNRIQLAGRQIKILNRLAPELAKMHAESPTGPEECSRIMEHSFVDPMLELRAHAPAYSKWLRKNESNAYYYRELKVVMQLLGMDESHTHWVCKSPRHAMTLENLISVFSNAKIVWTHRDPSEVLPSFSSLTAAVRSVYAKEVTHQEIGPFWLDRLASGLEQALKFRQKDAKDRYVDVHYNQLVADPISVVRTIYRHHQLPYTIEFENDMLAWLEANPKNKHGRHTYSLEKYGLSNESILERFEPLGLDRFL